MAVPAVQMVDTPVASADDIRTLIDRLVHERQRLRAAGAAVTELEANRLAIVYWQRRLGGELGRRRG